MRMVTSGQKDLAIQTVTDAAKGAAEEVINSLPDNTSSDTFQRVLAAGGKIKAAVMDTVRVELQKLLTCIVGVLKLISAGEKIIIGATEGTEQISDAEDTFKAGIDSDFKNWGCDGKEKSTSAAPAKIYELVEDADFRKIFGGFGQNPDRLCFTRAQIRTFVETYPKWLSKNLTFFLFKEGDEFFVARVRDCGDDGWYVDVYRFSGRNVWDADHRYRVVVPQLDTLAE